MRFAFFLFFFFGLLKRQSQLDDKIFLLINAKSRLDWMKYEVSQIPGEFYAYDFLGQILFGAFVGMGKL